MIKKNILVLFGTRPEAIKLAPVIKELKKNSTEFNTTVCVTGQHKEMLYQILDFFEIVPDIDLKLMTHNQSLTELTSKILLEVDQVIKNGTYDYIIVQGDTTTVYASAVSAFYNKIKIIHVEAGLRSFDFEHPFPEEFNRRSIASFTNVHFAPSERAKQNLLNENIDESQIWNVGNTVIDSLQYALPIVNKENYQELFPQVNFDKDIVLVTGHRRENFGGPLEAICGAFKEIAQNNDVQIVYPVHLNPNVKETVHKLLDGNKNIHLIPPLPYPQLIWIMNQSKLVITDSGGIQEEAPAMGKPVLVTREVTERKEVVESGNAIMVGNDTEKIIKWSSELLTNTELYNKMSTASNPYGNGDAALKMIEILKSHE
tara:strand:+ start:12302 stop:13417 length:1116 start_codon:yes stop_codon:yes gene_type:complete